MQDQLPALAASADAAELHFTLDGAFPFASWSASYIDAAGKTVTLASGGGSFDPDASSSFAPLTEAAFAFPPEKGTLIVQVAVSFGTGGDAIYGWKVTAP